MRNIDCRGMRCPLPIIMIAERIKNEEPGSRVILLSDDPATWPDLQAWGRMQSHFVNQIDEITFEVTA